MKVTRVVALAVIAASMGVGALHAQNLRNAQAPAEFPPASFKGSQYVDSKGCVFIRAGIDGNVTWVPRVNRQRQLVCGQSPSLSANAAAAVRTQPAQTARNVEQITVAPPAATPAPAPRAAAPAATRPAPTAAPKSPTVTAARPAPAPAPRRVTVAKPPAPKPAPRVTVRRPAAPTVAVATPRAAPKPVVVQPAAPAQRKVVTAPRTAPAPRTAAAVPTRQPACTGASPVSSRYINSGAIAPVRCGPQPLANRTAPAPRVTAPAPRVATAAPTIRRVPARTVTSAQSGTVGPQTRVVPRQVFDARQPDNAYRVPKGYRPVWEDDRLNPRRAEQSLAGVARTRLIWTNTVPRRLIDRETGRDVTTTVALVYPYTDTATQQRELGTVTLVQRDGVLGKRIVRNKAKARQPTVSTRSAPAPVVKAPVRAKPKVAAKPAPKAVTKGRYVQVGTFGQPANAQAAAQRIIRAGLPARIGKVTRGGKTYQVVVAGPFAQADLGRALARSRSAGFGDAFVR
ncbi:SPOR domain-containing protein [uncultured Tateyamaria sp.]|uniref:SPOR domain-containing protein n=1 Tax=uncultured Tateyamaria sp. TaxID=455651 RepID=UPI00261959A5|nr:SPOR domain-containing protein [uncultured Tateyamaria sp.]